MERLQLPQKILFHKTSVSIEFCILPTLWQYKNGAHTPILLFQLLMPLQSGGKKWQRLISRTYNAKKAIKIMRRMALMAQKQSKELSNEILVQKGANLSRNERQRNDAAHPLLPNLVLHLDEERREVRSQVKRSKGGDLLVRLRLHRILIPRALRVRKTTKKPRGSILYQMKINLNGTSHLSFHLMQAHSLRNTSQRKLFTTQSVKYIPCQTT